MTFLRWAEPFEALRDRAAMSKTAKIFFANLGPLPEFSARAGFARNLIAAGGIGALGPDHAYPSLDALTFAFKQSGARVAILCGADARYLSEAEAAARALKAAGADWLVMAGHPGDREGALQAAGVDQFLYAGQDALAALETLHAALGIGA
jgi:methylmalonyl-CoA mutase